MGVYGHTYRWGAPFSTNNLRDESFCPHCKQQGWVILDAYTDLDVGVPCPMCVRGRMVDTANYEGSYWLNHDYRGATWNVGMDWSGWDVRRNQNPVALRVMRRYEDVSSKLGGVLTLGGLMRLVEAEGVA